MIKIIYFTAGIKPTVDEQAEIEAIKANQFQIFVRNGAVLNKYGNRFEACDYVLGTPPAAYADVPVWEGQGGTVLYFIQGIEPTNEEIEEIETAESGAFSLFVRNAAASSNYGNRLEAADYAAGAIPVAYNSLPVWEGVVSGTDDFIIDFEGPDNGNGRYSSVIGEPVVILAIGDFSAGLVPPTINPNATWSYWSGGAEFPVTNEENAIKMVYPATEGGASGLTLHIEPLELSEIYIEFWQKMINPHAVKNCKIFGVNSDQGGPGNYANATFGLSGGGQMTQSSFGDGTAVQNDTQNTIELGGGGQPNIGRSSATAVVVTPQNDPVTVFADEQWHRVRLHQKFNSGTTAENEVADGESYVEVDGLVYNDSYGLFNRHWSNLHIQRIVWGDYAQDNDYGFTTFYRDHIISKGGFFEQ